MDSPIGLAHLLHFGTLDCVAVALLFAGWLVIGRAIEHPPHGKASVSVLMRDFRRQWMREFVTRSPRIFDSAIIDSLRQGTSFFVSATMIAIGGGLALLGNADQLSGLARDLTQTGVPTVVWEIKIIVILLLVTDAFLKFVWAHRLFGYCAILMAAVPNDPNDPDAYPRADQAADVNIQAARNFNAGLRSVYFALGALPWLLGALPLLASVAATVWVLWRREFASRSRMVMLRRT
ncbi:DUF599 domain-containing protein [Frigidibacter oleivorans]|uniref:DUF599 domain-containing protein n=1 Tax=Frigidibacter oleivorans TaxID=2487129 RepID=UPI000F8C3A4D|nr:DUF599 domain-containing protein [Frigidibacter oleivorans]